ncbi:MAG TPA: alpha/beta-hydrolase family protein [Nocardioidaceae bacterium]|nr:alpha/beta-hydrolase family protein [Nocardioidaceae bacterium]
MQRVRAPLPALPALDRIPYTHRRRVSPPQEREPLSLPGVAGALLFGAISFTPSLAPRDWLLQGIVNGLSAAIGYGVGVFVGWVSRVFLRWSPSDRQTARLWTALGLVGFPVLAVALWQGQRWQEEIHLLVGLEPPDSYAWVRMLVLAVALLLAVIGVARALRWAVRKVTGWLDRMMPEAVATPVAILVVALVLMGVNDGILGRGLMSVANSVFSATNSGTSPGTYRSMAPERSGSPASLVSWESLGLQGRDFVGGGPGVADLTAFSGEQAMSPVRVYAGLRSAPSTQARADLAVRELRRTGGFDREVLVVATTTGTGYVDPAAVEAVEYMYNGDTASVGIQYSYLPSWISFLADHEKAKVAARILLETVHEAWSALPEAERPLLLTTATSLGVFGSEATFEDEQDLLESTDGVVWAGPPSFSPLHQQFVADRDEGSPAWRPEYDGGAHVRFLAAPDDAWDDGRLARGDVVYLQHGSDPVTLWSPRLAYSRPDWLEEARAPDVSPDMFWIPGVTFWQVTADLAANYGVPAGHGHRYVQIYADGFATVAAPEGWTHADSLRLRAQLKRNAVARERTINEAAPSAG